MTLDRKRWAVRYYLWLVRLTGDEWTVEWRIQHGTNLCSFVWRIVGMTLLMAFFATFGTMLLCAFAVVIISDPLSFLVVLGGVVGFIALAALLSFVAHVIGRVRKSDSIALAYIKAWKQGICPLIKFSND